MPSTDVAIIGLGAMGSATAWQCAARGLDVAGFDRFRPPHDMGSSTGRSRIIREAYWESPFYVPMVRRAWQLWAELEQQAGVRLFHPTRGLVIGRPDGALVSGAIRSAAAHAVPVERLTAAQVRERFPLFQPPDGLVGVLEPRAGVLLPEAGIRAMLHQASARGAELHYDEPVLSWTATDGGFRLETRAGWWTARRLVLTAGAWLGGLVPELGLPLRVARQTMFWMRPGGAAGLAAPDRCPVWLWETGTGPTFYGFPDLGDGPKVARHHGGATVTADAVDRTVHPSEAGEIRAFLAQHLPGLDGDVTRAAACLYTNTPDEHFVLDRHPWHSEVLVASPCSGHGFKFAPAIGEALADLAIGATPRFDLTPFRLGRFAG